jgi:hypothetical protein
VVGRGGEDAAAEVREDEVKRWISCKIIDLKAFEA